ncbi:uncharacterized protein G2W53_011369 [Senna tora]|uniref:Uncharacterized protein n=1 Tax=Senna tora TaxID=362788 RepID=A0A834WX81_9FABA|nr:uncharacterized protein G2W53_027936 [Senna tora]KAF7834159.1 uncharacterized protein G2W53_009018 [Senna tora]KAF7836510.1 uncharacterized protein G2W53_011369 [Senna tora]
MGWDLGNLVAKGMDQDRRKIGMLDGLKILRGNIDAFRMGACMFV